MISGHEPAPARHQCPHETAISVPDPIFARADRLAKRLNMSRSALYTRAVDEFIGGHQKSRVREKLDAIYSTQSSAVDPAILAAQAASQRILQE